ncbi:MAG TPA: ATP-binding protein [Clostridia bacterium]|jgi:ATP-dependent DNA helicase RecG|nr:AAA family ATPase [Clostridia bacterium]HQM96001.1 ATP-binding protein [Clostridia bacterium]HQO69042.1 ATP-binding protein [Clostridia bacterium]
MDTESMTTEYKSDYLYEFEATKSIIQDLSFNEAMKYFTERKVEFKEEQKRSLGIKNSDGLYTNLGLIFSDQCIHTIKLAIFQGINKLTFKDRKEFSGSILKQIDDVFKYIELFNRTRSEFSGLERIDIPDYPVEAVREALLNAITHRDYSYSSSTLISLFDDRIEFVSLGGLPKGINYNDMMLGISVLRNSRISDIFYRLHLIEAYGTGIQKIMESYDDFYIKPKIEVSDNAFKISLPNINYKHEFIVKENAISFNEQKVLDYLKDKYYSTRKEIENYSGLSQATTVRILASLLEKGLIIRQGEGKSTTYSKGF